MNGSNAHDTYHIYDAYHRLCYVLPPMVGADISDANLDKYAFRYSYDKLHRLVEKKSRDVLHTNLCMMLRTGLS